MRSARLAVACVLSLAACGGEEARATVAAAVPDAAAAAEQRAAPVFEAYCQHELDCGAEPELQPCIDRTTEKWARALTSREPCLSAVLEQLSCSASAPCGALSTCAPSLQKAMEACLELLRPPP